MRMKYDFNRAVLDIAIVVFVALMFVLFWCPHARSEICELSIEEPEITGCDFPVSLMECPKCGRKCSTLNYTCGCTYVCEHGLCDICMFGEPYGDKYLENTYTTLSSGSVMWDLDITDERMPHD